MVQVCVLGDLLVVGSQNIRFLPPPFVSPQVHAASCILPSVSVSICIHPGDNGVSLGSAQAPLAPHQGDTAEVPQAGMGWSHHGGGGLPRGCFAHTGRGQLVSALFKGQQFSTAGEGPVGGPSGSSPPVHMPPRRKCAQIRDLATHSSSPAPWERTFVFPARGCSLPRTALYVGRH